MEPRPRRTHYLALIAFVVMFTVSVETVGPDTIFHVDVPLAPAVSAPMIDEALAVEPAGVKAPQTTPEPLRALYVTGWTAGTPTRLRHILSLYEDSILNAVVIDIKDATGRLSYMPLDETLLTSGVGTKRIRDLDAVINEFNQRGIYVIGRISVFQDPYYGLRHPEDALKDSRTGEAWADYKGIAWLRPDSTAVREYVAKIAHDAYAQGFDEINVDYVRFPSDGPLAYIDMSEFADNKQVTMEKFFASLRQDLSGIPLSADVFGLTMSAKDDVGIGQKAALIAPSVDALAPMVYPSHFWNGTYGIPVPAAEPYKVIHKSLSDGIAKLAEAGIGKEKIRPWLQDFDLVGVAYDADKVRAQIQAAHDLGIESWMMWDPSNNYTKEVYALEKLEPEVGLMTTQ